MNAVKSEYEGTLSELSFIQFTSFYEIGICIFNYIKH